MKMKQQNIFDPDNDWLEYERRSRDRKTIIKDRIYQSIMAKLLFRHMRSVKAVLLSGEQWK